MIPVSVTLQFMRAGVKGTQRVKLSMDDKVGDTVANLVRDLGLPTEDGGRYIGYHLMRNRLVLDDSHTLYDAGVEEGDILQLAIVDSRATMGKIVTAGVLNRLAGKSSNEQLPINAALIDGSGEHVFELQHTRALIGRADAALGYPPEAFDVDLSELDLERTVSRPHALIVYKDGEFTIRDLYSQRGLTVNGAPISASKAEQIHDTDVIAFGNVQLQFRCGY